MRTGISKKPRILRIQPVGKTAVRIEVLKAPKIVVFGNENNGIPSIPNTTKADGYQT